MGKAPDKQAIFTDFKKIQEISVGKTKVGSTKFRYTLPGFWQDKLTHKGVDYDILSTVDSGFMQDEGAPALPQEGVFVAIPHNSVFKELKIISKNKEELEYEYYILPAPKPVFEGEELEYKPLKNVYDSLIVTKEQILTEFPDSNEDVAIRNFLIYATENCSLPPEYVVLGGNIDVIPTHIQNHGGEDIPSDHYYSDLVGDIYPDIHVSRFPASNEEDMKKICETASFYETNEKKWRINELITTYNRDDYNLYADEVAEAISNTFNPIKKYDGSATKQEVIDTINAGVGFINYRGHGSDTGWCAGNGLKSTDITVLDNGNRTPQVFSIACLTNNLDIPGYFGSIWMIHQKAVAFLGASRPSYTTINNSFDKYLWDGIINQNLERACDIFNWATTKLYQNVSGEKTKHNFYMYLLLGDPTASF